MKTTRIIQRARRLLQQIPYSDEDVRTDSAVVGSPTTEFSDENMLERVNNAQREVVSLVKAQHIPNTLYRYDTAAGATLPKINVEIVRLMFGRVTANPGETAPYDPQGYFAGSPTVGDIMYQIIAGRDFTISGGNITTVVNPTTTQTLALQVVGLTTTVVGSVTLDSGGTHTINITGGSFTVLAGEAFRVIAGPAIDAEDFSFSFIGEASVTDGSRVRLIQRSADRHRRMERSGRSATLLYPVYVYEDGELNVYPVTLSGVVAYLVKNPVDVEPVDIANGTDDLEIDERFETALAFWVVASCFQTMGMTGLYDYAMSIFEDEIDAYSLNNRMNALIDDREVSVE